jgi:uncharacterized protein
MLAFKHSLAYLLLTLAAHGWAQDFVAVPPLQARVTDLAGMLKPEERSKLEGVLKEHEERTGNQFAVLLVNSTAPEAIEQYSIRVADAWKLGRKGVDDGVILVVAKDNPAALRRLRIETGRGVQGSLTDAQSKRILQDVIAPHFRQNDYYGGLAAGMAAIAATVAKEQLPVNQKDAAAIDEGGIAGWLPFLVFAFFIFTVIARTRNGQRKFSSDGWGRSAGIILGSGLGYGTQRGLGRGWGGLGGGGGGGGGFSGGGGGFDGGGASGNW